MNTGAPKFAIDADPTKEGILYERSGWTSPTARMGKAEARALIYSGGIIPPAGEADLIRRQDIRVGWIAILIWLAGISAMIFAYWRL